ncbi:MAG: hypothetical protein WC761_06435 [Candidatus Paceibacterota bacterium]|jgi:hypothetical protein
MNDLYTEALKNAEKLREVAETDAKKRIIEKLTPYIKKIIAKEAAGDATDFYFEQAEDLSPAQPEEEENLDSLLAEPGVQNPTQDLSAGPLGDQMTQAPVDPMGSATMAPDANGQMKVNFDNLAVDAATDQVTITPRVEAPPATAGAPASPQAPVQAKKPAGVSGTTPTTPTAPATIPTTPTASATDPAAPAPAAAVGGEVPPTEEEELLQPVAKESVTYTEYQRVLGNISERVDRVLFTGNVSTISNETLKQRLFDLLEAVDNMRDNGQISGKQAKIQENKLEFLFLKLKEANEHNSYSKNNSEKGPDDMKTLKEFAAQLFEEDENLAKDSVSTGETGLKVDNEKTEHAMKVSGVDPEIGGKKNLGAAKKEKLEGEAISGKVTDGQWAEGEPTVKEGTSKPDANADVKKGAGGFGDTDEDPVAEPMVEEFEIDDAELNEAVRAVRKENIKRKLAALREESKKDKKPIKVKASKDFPNPGPEGGEDPSIENLKEQAEDGLDVDMLGGEEEEEMGGMDDLADLVLSIDLPPEVEEELAKLGVVSDDLDVGVELNIGGGDDAGVSMDDGDDEIEIVDDDADDAGSMETDAMLADDVDEEVSMPMENTKDKHLAKKVKMLESKLAQAGKLLEAKNGEINGLQADLAETNLFTAKTVYFSKFLQRALTEKALSKKVLHQIVEHLDRAKTVAESKAIFASIKNKLDEHASASLKLGGSSSKVAKPGSANLTENVSRTITESVDPNSQTAGRWQILAGIKKGE